MKCPWGEYFVERDRLNYNGTLLQQNYEHITHLIYLFQYGRLWCHYNSLAGHCIRPVYPIYPNGSMVTEQYTLVMQMAATGNPTSYFKVSLWFLEIEYNNHNNLVIVFSFCWWMTGSSYFIPAGEMNHKQTKWCMWIKEDCACCTDDAVITSYLLHGDAH